MDPRLLRLYTEELAYLRELGAEFAAEFPKVAGRLGMETLEVADPYVERLLEGFAFLTARIQLKLDAEQPQLIAHLLESIYPNFLSPVPSMLVARLKVDPADPNLTRGHRVPRGSALLSQLPRGQDTRCEFRTAQDVTLWPIELVDVRYFSHAPDLPLTRLPTAAAIKGGLRLRLRLGGGLQWSQLPLDRLRLYIAAGDDVAFRLHELMTTAPLGSWLHSPASGSTGGGSNGSGTGSGGGISSGWSPADLKARFAGPESLRSAGHANEDALLPVGLRAFSGYRLLQEAAALPQRLLFVDLVDLQRRLPLATGREAELLILFSRGDGGLEPVVDAGSLALFCTPAINLFPKRLDRLQLGPGDWEYHIVPDRTRPMDYEVHSLLSVQGFGTGRQAQQAFEPLYACTHADAAPAEADGLSNGAGASAAPRPTRPNGYYTLRRTPRLPSAAQQRNGPRTAYIGEEVYLALVDPRHAPYAEDLRQLAVLARVTNRDLPILLPAGGGGSDSGSGNGSGGGIGSGATASGAGGASDAPALWRLDAPGPVQRVEVLRGPTRPVSRQAFGDIGWRLVSHLTLNHLSLTGADPAANAAALRRMLALYGGPEDAGWQRMVEGVTRLEVRSVVRRLPYPGPLAFGSGLALTLELDELAFQGGSAVLFAGVLEVFFARHAAINSFSQLTLRTPQRGEVMRWPPRIGQREAV
jgi:type VI secretion system protein ImpG